MIISQERLIDALRKVYPMDLLTQEQFDILTEGAEALVYKSGKMIYLQGSLAEYVYLVFEGSVEIIRERNGKIGKVNSYKPISVFGYDAISSNPIRRTSAHAAIDSLVIRLNASNLRQTLMQANQLRDVFNQIIRNYFLMISFDLEGRKPDETIHIVGRPYPVTLLIFLILSFFCVIGPGKLVSKLTFPDGSNSIGTIGMFALMGITIFIANLIPYLNWRKSIYVITDHRVIMKELSILMFENRHEMGIDEIVSITNRTNVIGRVLGFGDLLFSSYTGNLEIKNIRKINSVQKILEGIQLALGESRTMKQKEKFDALIANRIESKDGDVSILNDSSVQPNESRNLRQESGFFEKLLGLKSYKDDTIFFRTHWLELFKRLLIPTVLLVSFLIFLVYMSNEQIPWTGNKFVFSLTMILMVGGIFWLIYQYIDWRNDRFIITKDQIIDINQKPFGLEDKRTAPINRIQSIRYKRQGLAGLFFNYGTVYIRIGDDELTFDHVHNPLSIQQEIFLRLEQIKNLDEEKLLNSQRDQVTNLIEAYHRFTPKKE